jgi:hypothetical protein
MIYKYFFKVLSLILLLLIFFFYQYLTSDIINFNKDDLDKDRNISIFFLNHDILDGKHNLDRDLINFSIKVKNKQSYFKYIDSVAIANKWNIGYSSNTKKILIKNIPYYSGLENVETIIFSKVSNTSEEIFVNIN